MYKPCLLNRGHGFIVIIMLDNLKFDYFSLLSCFDKKAVPWFRQFLTISFESGVLVNLIYPEGRSRIFQGSYVISK